MKKKKLAPRDESKSLKQTLSAASSVASDIQVASKLSLLACTPRGRLIARQVMHLKISNAVVRFGQYLQVVSVHDHPRCGALLVLRFCGTEFVATFWALSAEAQDSLAPAVVRRRGGSVTLPRAA